MSVRYIRDLQYLYYLIAVLAVVFLLGMGVRDKLPVAMVWFGHEKTVRKYPLTTVSSWVQMLSTWDWVSGYRLQWVPPYTVSLHVEAKTPIARWTNGRYISDKDSIFHFLGYSEPLPQVETSDDTVFETVHQMQGLQVPVSKIKRYDSGVYHVILESGDEMLWQGVLHKRWQWVMEQAKGDSLRTRCDFRHHLYASCIDIV